MMAIYRGMPDCGFTPMDGQFTLGEKMWPMIKGLIMTNIENDHNIILEGFQLLPQLLNDFPPEYQKNILPFFLFFSEQYIKDNFDRKILKYRSAIESRSDIDDLDVQSLIRDTKRLKEQCVKSAVALFEIKENYETEMKQVQDVIVAQVSRRLAYE
jgi:putative acetyltransferase